jgi:hypothetical protein
MADLLSTAIGGAASMLKNAKSAFSGAPTDIKEADDFYQQALSEQKRYHRTWYSNLALYMGKQWLDWDSSSNWLTEEVRPSWRVRMVANLIMPTIRTEAAKILKSNPNMRVVPGSDSQEARDAARIGDRVLDAKYYEDDFQRRLYNLTMWFLTCGSSFLWSIWDPKLGRTWSHQMKDPTGAPLLGPDGNPISQQISDGDVVHDASGPFEVLLEPGMPEDFNEHRRIMRLKVRDIQYLKDKYNVDVPAEDIKSDVSFHMRMSGLSGGGGPLPTGDMAKQLKNVAITKELFELPSGKFPEGRHFLYANGVYLIEPEPVETYLRGLRALPTAKFDHITVPGVSYGMSIIEQIGPLNVIFNKMNSAVVENGNMMGRPKVLSPQGALEEEVFTDEPGEVVEYTPIGGLKPESFKPAEMPQYFLQMKDSLPGLIAEVSGIFDVSKGKLPRRATSGKAIDLLQDADDTRMALTIKNFGSSLERVMSITLATIGKKYTETRLIKKVGQAHEIEVFSFKGADLQGADMVRVSMGVALSRATKVQIGLQLAEANVIPKDLALKIMELGDLNLVYDQDSDQVQYARFENMGMSKGIGYMAGEFEPHQQHIQQHQDYLNGPIGQKLPPEIKALLVDHIKQHKALEAMSQGQNLTGAATPPGGAPSLGGMA